MEINVKYFKLSSQPDSSYGILQAMEKYKNNLVLFFGPHPTVLRDHYWQSSENHLGSQGLNLGWLHGKQVFGVLYCYSSSRSTCFSGRKGVKQRAGGGWHVLQRQHLTLNLSIHPVPQISLLATGRRWTNPLALSLELILEPKTSLF